MKNLQFFTLQKHRISELKINCLNMQSSTEYFTIFQSAFWSGYKIVSGKKHIKAFTFSHKLFITQQLNLSNKWSPAAKPKKKLQTEINNQADDELT
jgi:hypothetical protein